MKQKTNRYSPSDYSIKALQRGMLVLDAMLDARTPLSLERICDCTGLPKSTAFRVVSNLIDGQYLVTTDEGYWLGLKFLRFGALVEEHLDLKRQALPFLAQLRDKVNETVHLGVFDETFRVVYLEKLSPQQAVAVMMSSVGSVAPMHCTALGKAMAAFWDEGRLCSWISANEMKRFTDTTITDEDGLLRELSEIRKRGYATDDSEYEKGVCCFGAPIRDRSGTVVAAVSVSAPESRISTPLVDNPIAGHVVETALQISRALGYYDGP